MNELQTQDTGDTVTIEGEGVFKARVGGRDIAMCPMDVHIALVEFADAQEIDFWGDYQKATEKPPETAKVEGVPDDDILKAQFQREQLLAVSRCVKCVRAAFGLLDLKNVGAVELMNLLFAFFQYSSDLKKKPEPSPM